MEWLRSVDMHDKADAWGSQLERFRDDYHKGVEERRDTSHEIATAALLTDLQPFAPSKRSVIPKGPAAGC